MRLRFFFLSVLISATLSAQNVTSDSDEFLNYLDKKVPELLDKFLVPGAAVAIIEDGKVLLQKGYGYADFNEGIKVKKDTGFNIASISKTITAWGVMKLVEEGKIDLDAPAERYLTRWQFPDTQYNSNDVTIRRLLSHTAGLSLRGYPGWSPHDTLPTIEESLNGRNNGPGGVEIIIEPGSEWKYSGGGYTILQLIIEEVTGEKYEDFMKEQILRPLGMRNSSFVFNEDILSKSSKEHDLYGEMIEWEIFTAKAAAGLHTTIEDFTHFVQAHFSNGYGKNSQILADDHLKEMMEPAPATKGAYGLGYQIDLMEDSSITLVGHSGANSGWQSFFRVDPINQDGFIVLTNGRGGDRISRKLFCDWINWKTQEPMADNCRILPSIANQIKKTIEKEGVEKIISEYFTLREKASDDYLFLERDINQLGYYFLEKGEIENAMGVLKLNVAAFPESYNVYDSYGEILLQTGNVKEAVENYKKSVILNPGNERAIQILHKLGVDTDSLIKEVSLPDHVLQDYIGVYQLSSDVLINVSKNGSLLIAKATGQQGFEIFPKSMDEFYLKGRDTAITFNRNENGDVLSLTLLKGGRKFNASKIEEPHPE